MAFKQIAAQYRYSIINFAGFLAVTIVYLSGGREG